MVNVAPRPSFYKLGFPFLNLGAHEDKIGLAQAQVAK